MQKSSSLPEPDADARTASAQLCRHIVDDITQHGGWISFARYMALALYTPSLGYYGGGAVKLGREGDFTTAPEITPLFGATLARPVSDLLNQSAPQILEFGAGSGKLARDVLHALAELGITVQRYFILELSGELRARQQSLLKDFPQVEWIDALPQSFSGVVIGNEVLDAIPVNLIRKTTNGWRELGVGIRKENLEAEAFVFAEHDCDATLEEYVSLNIPHADKLAAGYTTEAPLQATAFMRSVADMLKRGGRGAAIFIDYGFPSREYYLNQRHSGTLMCHYRHHAHGNPFFYPGLQDMTAHVDFTAMARAAVSSGVDVLAYMNQAAFLMSAGIGELFLRTSPEDVINYLPQANAVQMLLSPTEMGELFKALVVGLNVTLPEALTRADRSHRL